MPSKSPEQLKKEYQGIVRLYDLSEKELCNIQRLLKKAVTRLSSASLGSNSRLNKLLNGIRKTVINDIDLKELDFHLDNLSKEIHLIESNDKSTVSKELHDSLKKRMETFDDSYVAGAYKTKIQGFIDEKLSDDDMAMQLLRLVNELAIKLDTNTNRNIEQTMQIKKFVSEVKESLDIGSVSTEADEMPEILDNLNCDLLERLKALDRTEQTGSGRVVTDEISTTLIDLLSCLSLSEGDRDKQNAIVKRLNESHSGKNDWKVIIEDIAELTDKAMSLLLDEKQELQLFIGNISKQLVDIGEYVRLTQEESEESANQSAILNDSIDSSVDEIEGKVSAAVDINQLKQEIQVHLSKIKENVEEHKKIEQEKEKISKKRHEKMAGKLANFRQETDKLKEELEESRYLTSHDFLTKLPNRVAYEERIALEANRWQRNNTPLCIALWDIDNFKKINDTYGHDAGDRVLQLFSKEISKRLRKVDMFSRLGGDEFVLLMPDTTLEVALNLNNQFRESVNNIGFHYNGEKCHITASAGVAKFEKNDSSKTVMKNADTALYQSKRRGKNLCAVFAA